MINIGSHNKTDFTFAVRLEQLMRERNLYASDVARLTGIRRQRIREYTSGTYQPTAYAIRRIAIGLKVSADWLLDTKIER